METVVRLMISGGGTGGGVYPALAVVSAVSALLPVSHRERGTEGEVAFLWVGSARGPERDLVTHEGIPFVAVPSGPIAGVGLRATISLAQIAAGTMQAWMLAGRWRPDVLLVTGGWPCLPAALACWLRRVPVVILMPDIEPGATIRALARIATRAIVVAPESARHFRLGMAVETGYPLRAELLHAAGFDGSGAEAPGRPPPVKETGAHFQLSGDLPTLLVFGGSTGARSINRVVVDNLAGILARWQVIHVSGRLDKEWVDAAAEALPPDARGRYHPFEYLQSDEMALALRCADLVVSRAGASVLGEFPLFGLPAILVPYPHAWRYQKTNADALAGRGAAIRLADEKLGEELLPLLTALADDPARLARMAEAARALRRPDAAAQAARVVIGMAQSRKAR